ncbi:Rieske 2Fe-2S domain-containing protein [Gordonia sp. HNM0687]|uniref:Rieske 2Fe-2S domain-containing protein n=1 Tax=Gordonia mangrovi TaxID=2665643 RepID=A0A6L7GKS6_9ACTN|nr:Rieske 2Fe-2S domain-containing protein [Gordonia mangrovi]MDY6809787.1 Rieske 2Fe-2S domain-containing protein [Actinomycetota bacterium]MXP20093.1 Rieske 2Fe-2S domain-containing protein [Gordonia mangrovi]UVF79296.1 Rieske 2Fe-2S domain-containing protein [Gordonia mangrovi]
MSHTTTDATIHRLDELVTERRVHRSLYTDPAVFATEMTKVYGGTWTYLAHESEIPEPNDFVRRKLGLRPVIVTRGRDGTLHGLINRCTHRGATVCRVDSGNARSFMCPYHNWTFDNTGRLTGVPMRKGYGSDFNAAELGLGRLRVESYRGFIFGTLNHEIADLGEHLGDVTDYIDQWLDRWSGAELVVRHGQTRLNCKGNWKLVYDNSADGYHPGFSHASLLRMRKERYGVGVDMQWALGDVDSGLQTVTDLDNGNTFLDQRAEIDSYWESAAPMPGQDAYEQLIRARLDDAQAKAALDVVVGSGMNLNIFPNLLIIGNQIQVIEPIAVDETDLVWYSTSLHAPDLPTEVNALRVRLQEDFPAFGEPDDLANFEECQAGLGVEEMEWVVTHRHLHTGRESLDARGHLTGPVTDELPIRAFWREWRTRMISETKLVAR